MHLAILALAEIRVSFVAMPVTKKKGAIFAIYADSPLPSSHDSKSTLLSSARSPTKRTTTTTRKALSAVIAKPLSITSRDTIKGKGKQVDEVVNQPSIKSDAVNAKSVVETKSKTRSVTRLSGSGKVVPTKRQFEVFSSPSVAHSSSTTTAASASLRPSLNTPAPKAQPAPPPSQAQHDGIDSPAKRLRSSPRNTTKTQPPPRTPGKAIITDDKENVPLTSTLDSPASRTRSKSRVRAHPGSGSISSLAQLQLAVHSPVRRSPRHSTSINISTHTDTTTNRVNLGLSAAILNEHCSPTAPRADLVGDGRGTLTFKKGRGVAFALGLGESDQTGELEPGHPKHKRVVKSEKKGKGFSVLADGPLVDVSEAYGASGEEPAGFRA